MLPGGLDPMYRAGRVGSHEPYLLVEVLDGNQNVIASGLTYLAGSVTATLTSRVARTCTITFTEDMYPYEPTDLLAPYGNMIRAWRGIQFADGHRYRWIVFVGRIQETNLNSDGTCTSYAADFAADVVENKFIHAPELPVWASSCQRRSGGSSPTPSPRLCSSRSQSPTSRCVRLTWQLDRGQALDELATCVSAFWYPLADGTFTLNQYAWTVAKPPDVSYSDGDHGPHHRLNDQPQPRGRVPTSSPSPVNGSTVTSRCSPQPT